MSRSCQFQEIFFLSEYLHQDSRYIERDRESMTDSISLAFFYGQIELLLCDNVTGWRHCPHVNLSNGQSAGARGRQGVRGGEILTITRQEARRWLLSRRVEGLGEGWTVTRLQLVALDNRELSSHHMSGLSIETLPRQEKKYPHSSSVVRWGEVRWGEVRVILSSHNVMLYCSSWLQDQKQGIMSVLNDWHKLAREFLVNI